MEDSLWHSLNTSNNCISREQLELVVQKKKVNDVFSWFKEQFVTLSHKEYLERCPMLILQGPTGCGKTTTLKWISKELKIPIKEYSEITDTTAINFDLAQALKQEKESERNTTQSIDRRKAIKFEHFVLNSIRYNTLYPANEYANADAESEFDDDDGFIEIISTSSLNRSLPPPITGVIIHIETPLSFARSQRILIQTLCKLFKLIRDMSRDLRRRVAIVFESLEGECETISLPTKTKNSLGIQVFKFNPIIRTNMKKLIESLVKQYKNIYMEKETVDQLVNDSDGDLRACINTLQLIICNKSLSSTTKLPPSAVLNQRNGFIDNKHERRQYMIIDRTSPFQLQVNKKQKLDHDKVKQIRLNEGMLRDNTRSTSFFHILGKIFYQKRLYPEFSSCIELKSTKYERPIDRPYPKETSTEQLANLLNIDPNNLISWLHQHYHKFCGDNDIDKAAMFLENQALVDTTSLNATQSSQFYEMHSSLDQLQIYSAIESTIYSLYQDQSKVIKPSHKKISIDGKQKFIKSSVDISKVSNGGELYSFKKPDLATITKLVEDYRVLLDNCATRLFDATSTRIDSTNLSVDYLPYLNHMSRNYSNMPTIIREECFQKSAEPILKDSNLVKLFGTLDKLNIDPELDYENRHDKLMELVEEVELIQTRSYKNP